VKNKMKRVVVFSPSNFSLNTLCITALLHLKGVEVEAVIIRELLSLKRIIFELTKNGFSGLVRRIWIKVFLCAMAYDKQRVDNIASFKKELGLKFNTVKQLGRYYGIPVIFCKDLNDDAAVSHLKKINPDAVIFTGGGLIRKKVLEYAGSGVINAHPGILPLYRGMDVTEWAILENRFDCLGFTIHFMDNGVDTGDILRTEKIELTGCENLKQYKDRIERTACEEIVNTAIDYLDGLVERKPQKKEDGKQYFRMPYHLRKAAESSFASFQKLSIPSK